MKEKEPTTFEKCQHIRQSLLTRVGESLVYKTWTDEFKSKNIDSIHKSIESWEKDGSSYKIDPNDLTEKEMDNLEFAKWDEESNLRLIPIWLYPFLAENIRTESIGGEKHTHLSEIDNDHRFGSLSHGVIPTKKIERERSIKEIIN